MNVGENGNLFKGTVTSTNAYTVHISPTQGNGSQGVGQHLIETDAGSILSRGYYTAKRQLGDPNGKPTPVTLLTTTATVPVSSAWGSLDANCTVSELPDLDGVSPTQTNNTCTVWMWSGTAKVGDHACFAETFHEEAVVVAVAPGVAPSLGHDAITFAMRRAHYAGGTVWFGTGCSGVELTANSSGDFRYPLDGVGGLDAHTLAVVQFTGSAANPGGIKPINVDAYAAPLASSLSNTNGVVSFAVYPADIGSHAWLQTSPVANFSGVADAAFNGPCLNLTLVDNTGWPAKMTCNQASSSGHTSTGGAVGFGPHPGGNTDYIQYPMAEILGVQNFTANKAVDGTLRLEPNSMPLPPGATVEQPNHYSGGLNAAHLGMFSNNPYAGEYSSVYQPHVYGAFANASLSPFHAYNDTPMTMYAGYGGTMSPMSGIYLDGVPANGVPAGVYAFLAGMAYAPPIGGRLIFQKCPHVGCSNINYWDWLLSAAGSGQEDGLQDYPATDTLKIQAKHVVYNAPETTSAASFVCSLNGELLLKETPCR